MFLCPAVVDQVLGMVLNVAQTEANVISPPSVGTNTLKDDAP